MVESDKHLTKEETLQYIPPKQVRSFCRKFTTEHDDIASVPTSTSGGSPWSFFVIWQVRFIHDEIVENDTKRRATALLLWPLRDCPSEPME